jgi:hypothetical protein
MAKVVSQLIFITVYGSCSVSDLFQAFLLVVVVFVVDEMVMEGEVEEGGVALAEVLEDVAEDEGDLVEEAVEEVEEEAEDGEVVSIMLYCGSYEHPPFESSPGQNVYRCFYANCHSQN